MTSSQSPSPSPFHAAQQRLQAHSEAGLHSSPGESQHTSMIPHRLRTLLPNALQSRLPSSDTASYLQGPPPRVTQFDAELLDSELLALLLSQCTTALKYYNTSLKDRWTDEISLLLKALLFKLTVWDRGTSYGGFLQGVRLADARTSHGPPESLGHRSKWRERAQTITNLPSASTSQRLLYGLFTICAPYAWQRWEDHLSRIDPYDLPLQRGVVSNTILRKLSQLTTFATTSYSLITLLSVVTFITNGSYLSPLNRLLRLRVVPSTSQGIRRDISFEYLNRQLVWHAFTEFLLFLLPLVGIQRWRRWISKTWRKVKMMASAANSGTASQEKEREGELYFLPERTCAICYSSLHPGGPAGTGSESELSAATGGTMGSAATDITNPYEAVPCGCVYCFACLAQVLESEADVGAEAGWTCLRCGSFPVKKCKPWSGDVVIE